MKIDITEHVKAIAQAMREGDADDIMRIQEAADLLSDACGTAYLIACNPRSPRLMQWAAACEQRLSMAVEVTS